MKFPMSGTAYDWVKSYWVQARHDKSKVTSECKLPNTSIETENFHDGGYYIIPLSFWNVVIFGLERCIRLMNKY